MRAKGEFEVKLKPVESYMQGREGLALARMSLDKIFRGDLEAESQGEMLSAMTPVDGSAGYVAIEQVIGRLQGRSGSFVLQHYGIMDRGQDSLLLEVVPDSGTGQLSGISGKMVILMENGNHYYEFDYALE